MIKENIYIEIIKKLTVLTNMDIEKIHANNKWYKKEGNMIYIFPSFLTVYYYNHSPYFLIYLRFANWAIIQ